MRKSPLIIILPLFVGICLLPSLSLRSWSSDLIIVPKSEAAVIPQSAGPSDPPSELWNNSWGGIQFDEIRDLWGHGDYIYGAGDCQSYGAQGYDVLVTKWNKTGSLLKNVTFGTANSERARGIWGDATGMVLACDYYDETNDENYDILLLRYDWDLNLVWSREWGSKARELPVGMWSDGLYYYVCGTTNKSGNTDMLIVKFNLNGDAILEISWGGSGIEEAHEVWGDATGFYACGATTTYTVGGYDLTLVKFDYSGDALWYRTWGTPFTDFGECVWSNGTRVYVYGNMHSGGDLSDLVFLSWDAAGTLLWNKTLITPKADLPQAMWVTDMAVYLASTSAFDPNSFQYHVEKYDREGNYLWNITWGTTNSDEMRGIFGDESGLYFCGNTWNTGGGDAILVMYNEPAPAATDGNYLATKSGCDLLCWLLILLSISVVAVVMIYEISQHNREVRDKDDSVKKEPGKEELDFD